MTPRASFQSEQAPIHGGDAPEVGDSFVVSERLLLPALAALVVRQASMSVLGPPSQRRMVTGVSQVHNETRLLGLRAEDRRAMALVSRACMTVGLPDHGAEIHGLLARCTEPLGTWLDIPSVHAVGLAYTRLVEPEDLVPTAEAQELARAYPGKAAAVEEVLFERLNELLDRQPEDSAHHDYSALREFVVRHPLCTAKQMWDLRVAPQLIKWLAELYEEVPESWEIEGVVPLCDYCGGAMRRGLVGLSCRSAACKAAHEAPELRPGVAYRAQELLRVTGSIRQYWVEPGLSEIILYDAMRAMGLDAALYPRRDEVDIATHDIGIDLKAFSSPEMLGTKFRRAIGGLVHYRVRWVVIPDALVRDVPGYLQRLKNSMGRADVDCMSVTMAIERVSRLARSKDAEHAKEVKDDRPQGSSSAPGSSEGAPRA